MPDNARRKEKHRLKRAKKKDAMRRVMSVSPYKRVGEIGAMEACYINSDWQESGVAQIHVVRRNPAGGYAIGSYLIDLWCAGLKDAWGRLDFLHEEMRHLLDRTNSKYGIALVRIDLEPARALVASSIRFARQNGFRLPRHYDRWTALLGDIGDINSASLAGFGKDGGLLWIGPIEDLRQRLIGCTVNEFFARPGVHYIAEIDAPDADAHPDDEDDSEDDEGQVVADAMLAQFTHSAQQIAEAIRQRCLGRGEDFTPLMLRAVHFVFATTLLDKLFKSLEPERDDNLKMGLALLLGGDNWISRMFEEFGGGVPEPMKQAMQRAKMLMTEMSGEIADLFAETIK